MKSKTYLKRLMRINKHQPAIFLSALVAMVTFACCADEPTPEHSEGKTSLTPSAVLDLHRSCFLLDCDCLERPSNLSVHVTHKLLMTNVVNSIIQTKQLSKQDVDAGISMINQILKFQAIKTDKDAVAYLLNSLSAIKPVSTNEYARELKVATEADIEFQRERRLRPGSISIVSHYRGPNTTALEKKWGRIFDHNKNCAEFHTRLVDAFALTIPTICKTLDEKGRESLYDAVKKIAGLTEGEKKQILNGAMPTHTVYDNNSEK